MKQSNFFAIAIKNVLTLFTCSITLAIALPSFSQSISFGCYMINQYGEVVDLSDVCGQSSQNDNNSSPPPPPPEETSKNSDIPKPSPEKSDSSGGNTNDKPNSSSENPEAKKNPDGNKVDTPESNKKKTIPVIQN